MRIIEMVTSSDRGVDTIYSDYDAHTVGKNIARGGQC